MIRKSFLGCALPFTSWLLLIGVLGFGMPGSETAAGGNYHLRYLSPNLRQSGAPAFESKHNSHSKAVHAMLASEPSSIYVLGAGFLWSDHLSWQDDMGAFVSANERMPDTALPESGGHRSFFADPFAVRHPWAFHRAKQDDHPQKPQIRRNSLPRYLRSGELVYLQSVMDERYVTVNNASVSIVDTDVGLRREDDNLQSSSVRNRLE